jgi:multiple antibiotic resistance protein
MIATIIAFIVLLNPFALFIYLQPVMRDLSERDFHRVLLKATLISFGIFGFFVLAGDFIFKEILQINFESFRIFGGIIIFTFAFLYIVQGKKSLISMKEDLDDLAADIALPFMVGAGTISLCIVMSYRFSLYKGMFMLSIIMVLHYIVIFFLIKMRNAFPPKFKVAFDKNMEIALRLNGLFVGAIGLNMIVVGLNNLYFAR